MEKLLTPFGLTPFGTTPQNPDDDDNFYSRGLGSGFVWDTNGHIITNYHVVENATDIEVVFSDETTTPAELLGIDPDLDLAVIKVDRPAQDLQPVTPGDSDDLQVGQIAIAIGNPFGQQFTMTGGIISAVGRVIRSGYTPYSIPEIIQTDAPINPGNSGGPLLNRQGEVIGINSQIISRSGSSAGIGFAIPINLAQQVIPTLIKGEAVEHAWLGITGTTLTAEVVDFMELPADTAGALVIDVVQDSPADKAGLRGSDKTLKTNGNEYQLGGDVITAVNDQPVEDMDELVAYLLEEIQPGDEVTLAVLHPDGDTETIEVTLEARPAMPSLDKNNDE
jgi:2-alkenal reductase